MLFWRSREGLSRLRLATFRLLRLVGEDIRSSPISVAYSIYRILGTPSSMKSLAQRFGIISSHQSAAVMSPIQQKVGRELPTGQSPSVAKPMIFVSACENAEHQGGYKYNGGIKMLNLLVKLLRRHGYEAYMVTYDGMYEPWLIEHQPHISMEEFRAKLKTATDVRCVTSWAQSTSFISECGQLYFWDMELAYTEHEHFSTVHSLFKRKKLRVAGCNSMICAWHMANWSLPCTLLMLWIDEEFWFPQKEKQKTQKIGYMLESESTEQEIAIIKDITAGAGLDFEFQLIRWDEQDCLESMRSCNVFLGMNHGKDPLFGEGFGMPMMEAMWAGCVVIAYDVLGNRDFIHSGFNGILVPRARPHLMANILLDLYKRPVEIERMRENALNMLRSCHTSEARWLSIKEFLDL